MKQSGYELLAVEKDFLTTLRSLEQKIKYLNNLPVLKVEDDAFSRCTNAKSISIPDSVIEICFGAFNGCSGLEKISLPFIGKNKYRQDLTWGSAGIGERRKEKEL